MAWAIKKLKPRLNSGKDKMFKNKFKSNPDRHGKLFPQEINCEELAMIFLCSPPTIRYFIKIAKIIPIRKANQTKCFDREKTIKKLSMFAINGRLSQIKNK